MKPDSSIEPQIGGVFPELLAALAPLLRLLGVTDVAAAWHLSGMLREARPRRIVVTKNGHGFLVTSVQPLDEGLQRGWEEPAAGSDQDPDAEVFRDLEVICHALAGIADTLSRFSPRAVPTDRVRKAIHDLRRILDHAATASG